MYLAQILKFHSLRLHFDGFGPWLVFSWGALRDAFTTEVISSKEIVLQWNNWNVPCKEIQAGAELLSLLFEKCRCISKAVVIKILGVLFFSKGNSDDNVPKRLWA